MRFSILIPVFNVEKYLAQCLESVLMQDYSDFEVILVNDGSTDQSPLICKNFAERDNRIRYYNKKNEGLLLTRRFSIRHASGEYILFLDSDDFWEPGILSSLNREIVSSHADLICYRYRKVTDDGKFISDDIGVFPDRSFFNRESKEAFLIEFVRSSRLNVLWAKCVRHSIIDEDADYSLFEDKKGEDLLQSIALIRNADTILYLDDVFVNYRQTPLGRARTFKMKYLDDYEIVKTHIYSNLVEMKVSDTIINAFYIRYIESLIDYVESIVAVTMDLREFKEYIKKIENFPLYKKVSVIIQPDTVKSSCKADYINIKKHRYLFVYLYHKTRILIKNIISH